jgi:hypothetical protein
LLAAASADSIRVWDVSNRREIDVTHESGFVTVGFHPQNGSLFATGSAGFNIWPLAYEEEASSPAITVGPKQGPDGLRFLQRSSLSADGKTFVIAGSDMVVALALAAGAPGSIETISPLGRHPSVTSVSVSPDGMWGASGTWKGTGVKIWDLSARKLLRDLPVVESAHVAFSPDGKWLATATGTQYRFWNVETWETVKVIPRDRTGDVPGPICFSPDGRLMAVRLNLNKGFTLFDAATFERLAEFEAGQQFPLCFSPDGTELAVQGDEGLIQIWDLGTVRARLREMKLDFTIPAFAPPRTIDPLRNEG